MTEEEAEKILEAIAIDGHVNPGQWKNGPYISFFGNKDILEPVCQVLRHVRGESPSRAYSASPAVKEVYDQYIATVQGHQAFLWAKRLFPHLSLENNRKLKILIDTWKSRYE